MEKFTAIVLAAGMGTRMKSDIPKVIHKVCGKPLCGWVIDAARAAGADSCAAVIGHCAELVRAELDGKCGFAVQSERLGTGHAVMQAAEYIKDGCTVILNGDTPLVTAETIKAAVEYHTRQGNSATVITAILPDATGYGRIIKDEAGNVLRITEQKDATEEEKKIREVNSGMYVFDSASLSEALKQLTPNNAQGEYYLTDTLEIIRNSGKKIGSFAVSDNDEIRGVNDRVQLAEAQAIMQKRINERFMLSGVTMHNPSSVIIEDNVVIGKDTVIGQNVIIKSGTEIGSGCYIGMGTTLDRAVIRDGVSIESSMIIQSEVRENTAVGPFAYIRPNCTVGRNVKVGDFVELKNAVIDDGTKIAHLTYVGDADVGKRVNFGCGTVVVNYDGQNKHRTTIGDDVFIGCNTNLVSPVKVNDGAFTAAGSTITDEVPENALAIARARQVNKTGWERPKKIKKTEN